MRVERFRADHRDSLGTTHLTRVHETPRRDWESKTRESGLTFGTLPGVSWGKASSLVSSWLPCTVARFLGFEDPYWNESASYCVSDEGMWRIEKASYELHSLILEAVEEVVQSDILLESFGIPQELWAEVRKSWENRETDLLGRFDFLWDGEGEPKLAEYNADTPTVLVEAAAAQRDWIREKRPEKGQFNVLDEAIEDGWRKIALEQIDSNSKATHLTVAAQGVNFWNDPAAFGANADTMWKKWFGWTVDSLESNTCFEEEAATGKYLQKLAARATSDLPTVRTKLVDFDTLNASDLRHPGQGALWKLYPWEWLVYEDIGEDIRSGSVVDSARLGRRVLEPTWKLVASSKAMLAYLWRKHPNHPNLLPSTLADELVSVSPTLNEPASNWVSKPALGREGTGLEYGDESGMKTLNDFAREASKVGQVLVIPEAPPPPSPALSTYQQELHQSPTTQLFHAVQDRAKESPLARLFDHGPVHGKQHNHVELHLGPPVVQQYHDVASMHGRNVVTSAWVVRGVPVAACFREDNERTTNNNSCFVPHWVEPTEKMPTNDTGTCGCPPRAFVLTSNQERIRTELYGGGEVCSTDYGGMPREEENLAHAARSHHGSRCYGAGGYGGRGRGLTGGGRTRLNAKTSDSAGWLGRNLFRGSGRSAKSDATKKAEEERQKAKATSSGSLQNVRAIQQAREAEARAAKARAAKARASQSRTGSHGHGTTRGGYGYSG